MLKLKISNFGFTLFFFISIYSCQSQYETSKNNSPGIELENNSKSTVYEEHDKVTSGMLDKDGNLWFGTSNEGIYRYDGKSFINFTERNGLPSNYINCILEDKDGNLWFGTNNGLGKYDGESFTSISVPWEGEKKLGDDWWNSNVVQCMLEDRNGNIWLGSGGHGAYRYDGSTFTNFSFTNDYPQSDGLHHNYIQSMIEDTDGNIWLTSMTHGGVSRFNGKEFTHFTLEDGLMDDMVFSSFEDRTGKIWFGSIQTKHKGLYLYDGKNFTGFGKEDGLCDNFITGFYEGRNGKLWIRTGTILCIYDGENFAPFITPQGKTLKGISFIIEDKEKNIWLGGQYGHLWKYDGKRLIDFTKKGN